MADDAMLLRVGELARRTGLTVRTLHHYDQIGLLQPGWRSGGDHRLYDADDVRRLLAIQQLKGLGLSLAEVQAALDDDSFDASALLDEHIRTVEARLAAEQELLGRLVALRDAAGDGWEEVLGVIGVTERLAHPDPSVRVRAVLDSPQRAPLATLVDALAADPDPSVRESLTWAVVQRGSGATAAVLERLDDPQPAVRLQMAHVLSKLGDPSAIDPLTGLLGDEDPLVAAKAAFALGQLGRLAPDPRPGVEALVAQLGSGDEVHQDTVAQALAMIGQPTVGAVVDRLDDRASAVRRHAAEVLGLITSAGQDEGAVDALVHALGDAAGEVRFQALLSLGQLRGGTHASRIDGAIAGLVESPDRHTALLARRLLQE